MISRPGAVSVAPGAPVSEGQSAGSQPFGITRHLSRCSLPKIWAECSAWDPVVKITASAAARARRSQARSAFPCFTNSKGLSVHSSR